MHFNFLLARIAHGVCRSDIVVNVSPGHDQQGAAESRNKSRVKALSLLGGSGLKLQQFINHITKLMKVFIHLLVATQWRILLLTYRFQRYVHGFFLYQG